MTDEFYAKKAFLDNYFSSAGLVSDNKDIPAFDVWMCRYCTWTGQFKPGMAWDEVIEKVYPSLFQHFVEEHYKRNPIIERSESPTVEVIMQRSTFVGEWADFWLDVTSTRKALKGRCRVCDFKFISEPVSIFAVHKVILRHLEEEHDLRYED